jgi:glyoxylase-like metal-dependent hydrolase (beta-lactamase superfamily II)
MSVECTVISIGTLSMNRLWGENIPVRASHATTTLVTAGDRRILVDPSLPAAAMEARFHERTGRHLADVTDVFCTTLRPVHRRSLEALPKARWWANPAEIDAFRQQLQTSEESHRRLGGEQAHLIEMELRLLDHIKPCPDELAPGVQLFPLPGASAGSAGLLVTSPTTAVLIAGDAALTAEHVQRGQVWEGCADAQAALESLQEMVEIADVIVPGHDNLMLMAGRLF